MAKKWLFLASFLALAALGLPAADLPPMEAAAAEQLTRSPRHGEWVSVEAGAGGKVNLWVVYPERKDRAPVVLVVHEIFGLTDWARSVTDNLAAEGFIAVAPDFLSGKGPGGAGSASLAVDQARTLNSALDPGEVYRRLDAAVKYATALPAARAEFGVLGFCWGGGISFGYATRQPALKASVVFYGTSPAKEALAGIQAPVLGLYGGNDARVNATVAPAAEELKRLGKSYETETYEGAGHAFLRQLDGQGGANLKAAQAAWPRTLAFLRKHLEAARPSSQSPLFAEAPQEFAHLVETPGCSVDECNMTP
jgi:carboxymethylenebutenolidase